MQKLLSLPRNLVSSFHEVTGHDRSNWFVRSDPEGQKIGSGGGSAYLLAGHKSQCAPDKPLEEYLSEGKRIIIHAGGHSRRLPAYAPSGKVLAPVPVFRWSQGQRFDQSLLDLQLPLLEKIMDMSGLNQNLMVAVGDVLILSNEVPLELPSADVVCIGLWADPHLASNHGVFFTSRTDPQQLDFMLQKPDHNIIERLAGSHLYMMDVGIWLLSDRAASLLMEKCGWNGSGFENGSPSFYDLYGSFGTCLGEHPSELDEEIGLLSTAIVPMATGEFYHYGTSEELITSTEKIQNKIRDQRRIWHYRVKPHPSLFVQNALADVSWNNRQQHIWIENSHIPSSWTLTDNHIITGIPGNDWDIQLNAGVCVDIVPVGENGFCLRTYGFGDRFSGKIGDLHTLWMGMPVEKWLQSKGLHFKDALLAEDMDIQSAPLFPVVDELKTAGIIIHWILHGNEKSEEKKLWLKAKKISADEICHEANLVRLFRQRELFRQQNLDKLARNYKRSVFYQSDLKHVAEEFAASGIEIPQALPSLEPALLLCRDHMFRSEYFNILGKEREAKAEEGNAFKVLQTSIVSTAPKNCVPRINIFPDQIVWGRSPARLDLAGGWSDTPPYCIQNGGSVLNLAVELNSQPPIQVFIRLCQERKITLRSIDNGVSEDILTFDDLKQTIQVGSVFAIPKAALYLSGFHPDYCGITYRSLEEQLNEFGGGIEISLLAAIPKGSGLGTSSILASTIFGTLSDFCSLNWDHRMICHQALILEQMLTTGGGWQDQYGGILAGIKLLESEPGVQNRISVRWMPEVLFTRQEYKDCWLLYYTGITRVAKNILSEIVRGMFLNEGKRLHIVNEIKQHAYHLADAIQRSDYALTGKMVAHSWKLNNALDAGTSTPEIQQIISKISDLTLGFKLLGAGGGGYMLIAARDPAAALRIQTLLTQSPPNTKARFVRMEVSPSGFQVTRS